VAAADLRLALQIFLIVTPGPEPLPELTRVHAAFFRGFREPQRVVLKPAVPPEFSLADPFQDLIGDTPVIARTLQLFFELQEIRGVFR